MTDGRPAKVVLPSKRGFGRALLEVLLKKLANGMLIELGSSVS